MHLQLQNQLFLTELREQFFQKIIDNWQALGLDIFGELESFDAIKNKNGFLETLIQGIEADIKSKVGNQSSRYLFSKDFLRRYIFEHNLKSVRIQSHTRTAIVLFLGYDSWEDFLEQNKDLENSNVQVNYFNVSESLLPSLRNTEIVQINEPTYLKFKVISSLKKRYKIAGLILGFILLIWGAKYWLTNMPFSEKTLETIEFRVIKTVGQYPQSVRIAYDISKLRNVKKVEVELGVGKILSLSSNQSYFFSSSKTKDTISQTYFYPGIYRLKLIVNDQIIKTIYHTVFSKPNLWVAWGYGIFNENNWITNISEEKNYFQNGSFHFNPADLPDEIKDENDIRNTVAVLTQIFPVTLDSLMFEARIKNPEASGGETCYDMSFNIFDEEFNILESNFVMKGCTDYAKLVIGKTIFRRPHAPTSLDVDLDLFGIDQNQWNDIKIITKTGKISVFVNENQVFSGKYNPILSGKKITDIRYMTKGTGWLDRVKVSNSYTKNVIYETDF